MKVRACTLSLSVAHGIAVLCAAVVIASTPSIARAAGVVGTGTPESCTDATLDAALAGGGLVTFNCGRGQVIIEISTKTIALDTAIDGGGGIIISGGENRNRAFIVSQGVNFTVNHLTIADGGGIANAGTLTVTDSTFTRNVAFDGSGIFNYPGGILTVTNCMFAANSAGGNGGAAIYNVGMLTVTDSAFTGNGGGTFGAVVNAGTAGSQD